MKISYLNIDILTSFTRQHFIMFILMSAKEYTIACIYYVSSFIIFNLDASFSVSFFILDDAS